MNITIFSGGTGSTNLIKGLKEYCDKNVHIINLINCYDDGKSTGVVRRVCDVLGPSDMRKCQYLQYINSGNNIDQRIVSLFEGRYDLPKDKEEEFCLEFIDSLQFDESSTFKNAISYFFKLDKSKGIEYKDFNISNIIYASLFNQYGYSETMEYFRSFLNISDAVCLNSFDNLQLKAITYDGNVICSEGDIVFYNNKNDPIKDIAFVDNQDNVVEPPYASEECIDAINCADLIIFSSGTQWSSLIPTYVTNGVAKAIENSKAKKILIMNNEEDGDMLGVNSNDIIDILDKCLPLNDIHILLNNDACNSLKNIPNKDIKYSFASMGNKNRKHDPLLLAYNIFKIYYGDKLNKDHYIFDFDGTIFDSKKDDIFYKNCIKLNELSSYKNVTICTGNSYKHICKHLSKIFGYKLKDFKCDIWADGGIVKYDNNSNIINDFSKYYVEKPDIIYSQINNIIPSIKSDIRGATSDGIACLSFTGLSNIERKILKLYLDQFFSNNNLNNKAMLNGKSTIDITNFNSDKINILNTIDVDVRTIFIGDNCLNKDGNDFYIATNCDDFINVYDISDTYVYLNTLINFLSNNLEK